MIPKPCLIGGLLLLCSTMSQPANVFGRIGVDSSPDTTLGQRISNILRSGSFSIGHADNVHIHINTMAPTPELVAARGRARWCLYRPPSANVSVDRLLGGDPATSAPRVSTAQEPTTLPSAEAATIPPGTPPPPGSKRRRRLGGILRVWWESLLVLLRQWSLPYS